MTKLEVMYIENLEEEIENKFTDQWFASIWGRSDIGRKNIKEFIEKLLND
jgi:hypothetical protein